MDVLTSTRGKEAKEQVERKAKPGAQRPGDRRTERRREARGKSRADDRESPSRGGIPRWAERGVGQLLRWGWAVARWTPGKRQGPHPSGSFRVPQGRGRGEEARHEPRLERGSGRVLQRPELEGAGRLHRPGSLVRISQWAERTEHPEVFHFLGKRGTGWGRQRETQLLTSLKMENRLKEGEMTSPRPHGFQLYYKCSPLSLIYSFIHSFIQQALTERLPCAKY